jgi:hypothetical protein
VGEENEGYNNVGLGDLGEVNTIVLGEDELRRQLEDVLGTLDMVVSL